MLGRVTPPSRRVRFENLSREAVCRPDETLFQSARRAAIRIVGACGGRGVCGTCMVRVVSGKVQDIRPPEAVETPRNGGWVRACQLRSLSDVVLEVAPRSVASIVRAEVDGHGPERVRPAPAVRIVEAALTPPALSERRSDADRLLDALADSGARRMDLTALRALPRLLRAQSWRVAAAVQGDEIVAVFPPGTRALGLAVDFGTTNCAGFLIDLETGARLATLGIENPQVGYGADLISRINHAARSRTESEELRAAAVTAISELACDLCEANGVGSERIVDVAVCGNTAMHHLLLGLPVAQLGRAPYVAAAGMAIEIKARDLGLAVSPGAPLHMMPNVGGFVGGDHIAALLATEQRWRLGTTILMDIGTNTEISLIRGEEIRTVSCPSGPAFEGGHISAGMRAADGAIERVRAVDGRLEIDVIGGAEPVGLCGSGVLDTVAALLRGGHLDARGAIRSNRSGVIEQGHKRAVRLAPDVIFTQDDVRAVQLAKAAIRSGIDLLLREFDLGEDAIDHVVIAGAFGTYINVESAITVGMLPPLPLERFAQVGNAAGVGVRMVLASTKLRDKARRLAARCRYVELGALPGFRKAFIKRIGFEPGG
jgi:uncharacterized 2Fe-2S/4Fe-4S cluster protein (DUF4445 family)